LGGASEKANQGLVGADDEFGVAPGQASRYEQAFQIASVKEQHPEIYAVQIRSL